MNLEYWLVFSQLAPRTKAVRIILFVAMAALCIPIALYSTIESAILGLHLLRRSLEVGYVFLMVAFGEPLLIFIAVLLIMRVRKRTRGYECHEEAMWALCATLTPLLFFSYFMVFMLISELRNSMAIILR